MANVVGHISNTRYLNKAGEMVLGFDFVAEELDYLDTQAEMERHRSRHSPAGRVMAVRRSRAFVVALGCRLTPAGDPPSSLR